jgi:hypothetical protein
MRRSRALGDSSPLDAWIRVLMCSGNNPCKCKALKCSVCKCGTKTRVSERLKDSGITVLCLKCQEARLDDEQA